MDFVLVLEGVLGGVVYSLTGLANKPSKEKFDWIKIIPTLIISAIVGGVAGYTGTDFGILINGSMAAGISAVVQKGWSAFMKYLGNK
jgi:hypothetical protein